MKSFTLKLVPKDFRSAQVHIGAKLFTDTFQVEYVDPQSAQADHKFGEVCRMVLQT